MYIVGADPGKMTGLTTYDTLNGTSAIAELPAFNAVRYVWNVIEGAPVVVCCERYDITGQTSKKSRQHDALKVTGALEYKCLMHGAKFVQFGRADAKTFGTDKKLREMKMLTDLVHGNDAARQVLMYLAEANLLPKLSL